MTQIHRRMCSRYDDVAVVWDPAELLRRALSVFTSSSEAVKHLISLCVSHEWASLCLKLLTHVITLLN